MHKALHQGEVRGPPVGGFDQRGVHVHAAVVPAWCLHRRSAYQPGDHVTIRQKNTSCGSVELPEHVAADVGTNLKYWSAG